MKFFVSLVILKVQKRQTTFWNCQDQGYFAIFYSKVLLLKSSLRAIAANVFKDEKIDIQFDLLVSYVPGCKFHKFFISVYKTQIKNLLIMEFYLK